ncbi:MAG: hypothetical protein U0232_03315 [Thermomicrobiales bacterium]
MVTLALGLFLTVRFIAQREPAATPPAAVATSVAMADLTATYGETDLVLRANIAGDGASVGSGTVTFAIMIEGQLVVAPVSAPVGDGVRGDQSRAADAPQCGHLYRRSHLRRCRHARREPHDRPPGGYPGRRDRDLDPGQPRPHLATVRRRRWRPRPVLAGFPSRFIYRRDGNAVAAG